MDEPQDKLDATGLACPLPVIKAKRALGALMVGQILEVVTTDPGSLADFPAWVRATGHEMVRAETDQAPFKFWIRRRT